MVLGISNPAVVAVLAIAAYVLWMSVSRHNVGNMMRFGSGNNSSMYANASAAMGAANGGVGGYDPTMDAGGVGEGAAPVSGLNGQETERLRVMQSQNALGCSMNDVSRAGNGGVVNSANSYDSVGSIYPAVGSGPAQGTGIAAGGLMNGNGMGVPGVKPELDAGSVAGLVNDSRQFPPFPTDQLTSQDLLPQEQSDMFAQLHPGGSGPLDRSFLTSAEQIGIDTVAQSLRNANYQVRSEPPNPQTVVSPWLNSTIGPDINRRPLEIGTGCE